MTTTIPAVRQQSGWFSENVLGEAGRASTETDAVGTVAAECTADECTAAAVAVAAAVAAANIANTVADDGDLHYY